MDAGILYVVGTPIGNLSDITYRAIETLKKVDLIVCEDTRTSKKLLDHYEIKTPKISFYQNIKKGGSLKPIPKTNQILKDLKSGKNMALITDAGTPGISDPGNQLVEITIKENISVIPIPGASSLTTLISVAGIDLSKFTFFGFPPHKKGRETFFKNVAASEIPVIYFESPHRLIKNLKLLKNIAPDKEIILGRELTKVFEEIIRGDVEKVADYYRNNQEKIKGEFIIILK